MQQGTDLAVVEIIVETLESRGCTPEESVPGVASEIVAALSRAGYLVRRPEDESIPAHECPSVWKRPGGEEDSCQRGNHSDNGHAAIRPDGTVASWTETL